MPILDSWYRVEDWRITGMVQPQSSDQESANKQLRSNASTEPLQISVLARKKIAALANGIVDIELTKFFYCPNKFLVFPTSLLVEPTKEFVIVFCLKKLFVKRSKILTRQKKKSASSISTNLFSPCG